tara:strand:+ start:304 stop:486 length:183 start_codon:yes stop_codon:yes gene_type:complete
VCTTAISQNKTKTTQFSLASEKNVPEAQQQKKARRKFKFTRHISKKTKLQEAEEKIMEKV